MGGGRCERGRRDETAHCRKKKWIHQIAEAKTEISEFQHQYAFASVQHTDYI